MKSESLSLSYNDILNRINHHHLERHTLTFTVYISPVANESHDHLPFTTAQLSLLFTVISHNIYQLSRKMAA